MEYAAHRLRFGDWQPAAVKSICSDPKGQRFAVGRVDGDVEIYSFQGRVSTVPLLRFPGKRDFKLQQLLFASSRLFGISQRGFIFECDFSSLKMKNVRDTYGGAAWCMAYNERLENITVGCDDGTSRVFTIQSDNRNSSLEYSKCYPTTGSRILSLAYHPSKPQLFLGCVDGTIRGIDENTGRSIFRLTGNLAKGVQIYITCLIVLRDSTIISGDSKGNVQVWDGSMGVLTLTIHQHAAQIFSLAVAPAEDFVFASGVDSRVTCLKRSLNDNNWVYTNSHRCHTHDVYSLAVLFPSSSSDNIVAIPREESYSEDHQTTALYCPLSVASGPLLISGGLDTKLCLYFVEDFLKYRPATILPTPAEGLLLASEDASLMALRHRHRIYLWSVNLAPAEKSLTKKRGPEEESLEGCLLVGELHLKDDNHIAAGAMNSAGTLLTVSSLSGIRMWQLLREKGRESVEIRRVALPDIANAFYHLLQFSPNGETLLAASSTGDIVFLSIQCEGGNESNMVVAVRDVLEHRSLFASSSSLSFGEEDSFVVTHMEMNSDHQWLAVSTVSGHLLIYDLDRLVVHWILRPSSSSSIACLSFHPNHPQLLAVVTSDNQVSLLDVDTRRKSEKWKFSTTAFENVIRLLTDNFVQIEFDPSNDNILFLRSHSHTVFIDLSKEIPEVPRVIDYAFSGRLNNRYRKKGNNDSVDKKEDFKETNGTIVNRYSGLVSFHCLENSQIVFVENPWSFILERLPDTLARKRYGT